MYNTAKNVLLIFLLFLITAIAFSPSIVEICSSTAIVLFAAMLLINRKDSFSKNNLDYIIVAYLLIALLSVFISPFFRQSLRAFFSKALQGASIYFVLRNYCAKNKDKVAYMNAAFVIAAVVVAIDGLFQYVYGWDFIRGFKLDVFFGASKTLMTKRITASMKYPNDLGIYLAFVIPIAAVMFIKAKDIFKKIMAGLAILLLTGALLLTYSRSAWLAFFVGLVLLAVFTGKRQLLLILFPLIIFLLVMPKTSTLIRSIKPGTIIDESIKNRLSYAKDAADLIRRNVIFGNGINTYDRLNKQVHPGRESYPYAHNCYLQMWAEIGLIGLLAFLSFLAVLFIKFFRSIKKGSAELPTVAMFTGVVVLLISFLFDTHFYSSQLSILFWSSCGILSGLIEG